MTGIHKSKFRYNSIIFAKLLMWDIRSEQSKYTIPKSDLNFTFILAVLYAISCYSGSFYNDTLL